MYVNVTLLLYIWTTVFLNKDISIKAV